MLKFTYFLPTKALQAIGIRFHMAAQLHNHSDQSTQPQEVQSRTIKKRLLNQFTQFVNFLDFCLDAKAHFTMRPIIKTDFHLQYLSLKALLTQNNVHPKACHPNIQI